MLPKLHHLKTWNEYFDAITSGQKNYEVRMNDRGFHQGDSVLLEEWNPETKKYTGRTLAFKIGYVLESEQFGLRSGFCVFALLPFDGDAEQSVERMGESLA